MSTPPKYKRLDRRMFALTEPTAIYVAEDHLLLVQNAGLNREVRRIFLEEIQALTCRRTNTYSLVALVLVGLLVIFGALIAFGIELEGEYGGFAAAMGTALFLPTLALLLLHLLAGPTCKTTLYTAVASHPLKGLNRIRRSRKVLLRLQSQVDGVQGPLPVEALVTAPADDPDAAPQPKELIVAAGELDPQQYEAAVALTPGRTRAHDLLFVLLLLLASSIVLDYFQQSSLKNLFDSLLHMGIVCVAFWAAIRQRRMLLPTYLRAYTLAVLGILILLQYAQGFSIYTFFMGNPAFMTDPDYMNAMSGVALPEGLQFLLAIQIILFGGLGIVGLVLSVLYNMRQSFRRGVTES